MGSENTQAPRGFKGLESLIPAPQNNVGQESKPSREQSGGAQSTAPLGGKDDVGTNIGAASVRTTSEAEASVPPAQNSLPRGSRISYPTALGIVAAVGVVVFLVRNADDSSKNGHVSTAQQQQSAVAPRPSAAIQPEPAATQEPTEVKPTPGLTRPYTLPEMAYCLAQHARVEKLQALMDVRRSSDIQIFNELVDDFNSVCSNYQYRVRDKTIADSYVVNHDAEFDATVKGWIRLMHKKR